MKRAAAELPFVAALSLLLVVVLSSVAVAVPDGGANNRDDPVLLDLRSFSPPGSSSGAAVDQQHGVSVDLALRTLDEVRRGRQGQQARGRGQAALRFLTALASSESFVRDAWRKRPVLIRSRTVSEVQQAAAADDAGSNDNDSSAGSEECWSSGLFTVEDDLLPGLDGTFGVPAQRTGDAVRDGSTQGADQTWSKNVPLPEGTTHRPLLRTDVESALRNGTVIVPFAGLVFPTLAALAVLTTSAFGLPTNVDVYVTPPGLTVSIPPHTDRKDDLIVQTQGRKRWKVYAPPPPRERTSPDGLTRKPPPDPFSRGRDGDVLTEDELGIGGDRDNPSLLLLDAILEPGDVLYVPAGFPHVADTDLPGSRSGTGAGAAAAPPAVDTSLHVTIGLDSSIWGLTYAHLRSMVLKRSGMASILGGSATIYDERAAGHAMEPLPIGFLGPRGGEGEAVGGNPADFLCFGGNLRREGDGRRGGGTGQPLQVGTGRYVDSFVTDLRGVMVQLEPYRFIAGPTDRSVVGGGGGGGGGGGPQTPIPGRQGGGREDLPPPAKFVEVAEFILCRHLPAILDAQDGALAEVTLHDPMFVRKMKRYSQVQTDIMKKFRDFADFSSSSDDPSSASSGPGAAASAPDDGGRGSSHPTTADSDWTIDKDDVIVAVLVLSAIIVGGPALFDLFADMTTRRRERKGDDEGAAKQKKA